MKNFILLVIFFLQRKYKSMERRWVEMKNIKKNIIITLTLLTLCSSLGYAYLHYFKTNNKQGDINVGSKLVVYNTHSDEDCPSGLKVSDVGLLINDQLAKAGVNSSFIKCNSKIDYKNAYKVSRDTIASNVKGYSNAVLLDIHRDISGSPESNPKKVMLVISQNNPNYQKNKDFADLLLKEIEKAKLVEVDTCLHNRSSIFYLNQDLSSKSVLIEVGNNKSSDDDIMDCINAIAAALKNVMA